MKKVIMLLGYLFVCSNFLCATVNVLIYGDSADQEAQGLSAVDGINAVWTKSLNNITSDNLSHFDVFYAASSYENDLDSKASVIREFLSGGGGVIVGQSNISGFIDWLPTEASVFVYSRNYPSLKHFQITSYGKTHPILNNLESYDIGTGPADTIYCNDLAPTWDILAVYAPDPTLVGMATNHYGLGRILLWSTCFGPQSIIQKPSEICIQQAFDWVSIPEPTTLSLLALGAFLAGRKRRK